MSLSEIAQKAENCLPKHTVQGVSCEYADGILFLRGRSRSFYEKQIAQESVKRIAGVARVVNEIEVVPEPDLTRKIHEIQIA
jgi:osmotically-inducible protein OsmY